MKQVKFYRKNGGVVIESITVELLYGGDRWPRSNWSGTEETFARLRAENPDVEFVEIPARH